MIDGCTDKKRQKDALENHKSSAQIPKQARTHARKFGVLILYVQQGGKTDPM